MPIRLLPKHVSSQIAAGEVIERPASVVRELLDNAIDVGATRIDVDISGKHFGRIIVSDDGKGMPPDDLQICLLRHATSKLDDDNIHAIKQLGFRGEALPSIASVANVRIVSRPEKQDVAFSVDVKAGRDCSKVLPSAGGFGTRIEVSDLFANVPARQAFQKSYATEMAAIREAFDRAALSWPFAKFTLKAGNKTVVYPVRTDLSQRIRDVRGEPLASSSIKIDEEIDGICVYGLTTLPTVMDERKRGCFDLLVNGRHITDKVLTSAVQSVYKALTGTDARPYASILIEIDPAEVNVNVHPTKSEVRFRDPGKVADVLRRAVDASLHKAGVRSRSAISDLARILATPENTDASDLRRRPLGRFLSQANNAWIFAETMDGIVIIDQHAAHERIILERLKKAAADLPDETLRLERPYLHATHYDETAAVEDMRQSLADFGFQVTTGDRLVSLTAYPSVLSDCPPSDIARLIVEHSLMGTVSGLRGDALWEKLATAACKAAIKAGHALTPERANALLREIEATPNASYCNHGRPTVRYLSTTEIGGMFERN